MEITTELVNHLAELSRITFDENETENFKKEFQRTMEQIDVLNSIDVSNVELLSKTANAQDELQKDEPHTSLSKEDVTKDAPETMGSSIAVPMMVD